MSKFFSKNGFGLIEVMAAAVVLGFLIVGLTRLQMGNRETILRVRDRDAANFIAQHVLDSISAGGMKSLEKSCEDNNNSVYDTEDYKYEYKFEGKNTGESIKKYKVEVSCIEDQKAVREVDYTTSFQVNKDIVSRSIEAKVYWQHRGSEQSIKMARVVR
jgi:prepilin-type N-terminal cleavage/methylation domain-containing protein